MSALVNPICRCFLAAALLSGLASAASDPASQARLTPSVRAVSKVLSCVVNVGTERVLRVSDPFEDFFNEYFGGHSSQYYRETIPLGSGILVDCGGLILTNYHVIRRASTIQVRLLDGHTFPARYVAGDAANDMALLQIQAETGDLLKQTLEFARPGDLLLGETVIAVGNPFGLGHSVTSGVLSAKNRSLKTEGGVFNDILQTDAAINPGNSGGPLINLDGQLIGMNLAIRRDAEGIGFAIPLQRLEDVMARWLVPSRFSRASCGFIPATRINGEQTEVVVREVEKDTPAAQAGLRVHDVITAIDGQPVRRALDVGRILWKQPSGRVLRLSLRDRAEPLAIKIADMSPDTLARHRLGLQLQELTPALLKALGLPATVRGLAISEVFPDSAFANYNIRRGDIVVRIGQRDTTTMKDVDRALGDKQPGETVPVYLITVEAVRERILLRQVALDITLQ